MVMKIKHSIVVLSYNQEKLLAETLDSILNQSVVPYEIIVCDDASTDNTQNIIKSYHLRYPNLIVPIFNDMNLGVFKNFNKSLQYPKGDLITYVSGDDLLPENILEEYDKFIINNGIDCSNSFNISTNVFIMHSDGEMEAKINAHHFGNRLFIDDKREVIELVLFNCLWGWDTGISRGLLDKLKNIGIRTDMGYQADLLWHIDKFFLADKVFFLNAYGYIYREGVGVTVATKLKEHYNSRCKVISEILSKYDCYISLKSNRYILFDLSFLKYHSNPTCKNYFCMLMNYLLFSYRHRFPLGNRYKGKTFQIVIPSGIKKILKKFLNR